MSETKEETNLPAINFTAFANIESFELGQRMAKPLAESDLVPELYKGKVGNCLLALEVAQRTKSGVLAVMQNLHIIKGRPSWSSSYIIAAINTCGRFNELEFEITDKGEIDAEYEVVEWVGPKGHATKKTTIKKVRLQNYECYAYTTSKRTGKILKGTTVSIKMAVAEGWFGKDGSKWQTMPELMLQYRSAAFFGRVFAPEILMGMQTAEEMDDFVGPDKAIDVTPKRSGTAADINKEFLNKKPTEPKPEVVENVAVNNPEPSVEVSKPEVTLEDISKELNEDYDFPGDAVVAEKKTYRRSDFNQESK